MGKTIGILAVCVAVYVAAVLLKRKKVPTIRMTFLLDVIQTGVVIFLIFFAILQIPSAHDTWDRVLVGSGAAAVVIGLAAQASLGNIFSGIMVLTSRPFEIGEKIQVGDTVGTVKLMTLQYTTLLTYLNEEISIPNSEIASSKISNLSRVTGASYPIEIQVAYGTDLDKAKEIIQDVIIHHPNYCDMLGTPSVLIKEAADSGIRLKTIVTTAMPEDNPVACSDCLEKIIKRFAEENIEIPYPVCEIREQKEQL